MRTTIVKKALYTLLCCFSLVSIISASSMITNLTNLERGRHVVGFSITPDGQTLVMQGNIDAGFLTSQIFSVPITGGVPVNLNPNLPLTSIVTTPIVIMGGTHVLYQVRDAEQTEIFVKELNGLSEAIRVTPADPVGPNIFRFILGFDEVSASVLYSESIFPEDGGFSKALYLHPLGSSDRVELSKDVNRFDSFKRVLMSEDWGRFLLWGEDSVTNDRLMYSVSADGTELQQLLRLSSDDKVKFISLNPSGEKVVFLKGNSETEVYELFSVEIAGGALLKLNGDLPMGGTVDRYEFANAGQSIVYTATERDSTVNELFVVNLDGSNRLRLSEELLGRNGVESTGLANLPNFQVSPDGQSVLYRADAISTSIQELFIVNIDGSNHRLINSTLARNSSVAPRDVYRYSGARGFSYSDDGKYVIYLAAHDFENERKFHSVNLENNRAVTLSHAPLPTQSLPGFIISPDSKLIAYYGVFEGDTFLSVYVTPIDGSISLRNQVVPRIDYRVGATGPAIGFEDARLDIRFTPDSSALIFRNEVDPSDAVAHTGIFRADFITDYDSDGLEGENDNCPEVANPIQLDTDEDEQGDACDVNDDNDEYDDSLDNCPLIASSDLNDTDRDGSGDICDLDDDNDLVTDEFDNCPLLSNINQLDNDKDGRGDLCDSDDDNDTVDDQVDNCPFIQNEDQTDSNRDGIGDLCEEAFCFPLKSQSGQVALICI